MGLVPCCRFALLPNTPMSRPKLPRSVRKFIRMEKARIRRTVKDPTTLALRIQALVEKYHSAA